ncbi:MAG: hypothetical protein Q7S01_02025 [bacterium]|nr:hypothetical protein [bacterium]
MLITITVVSILIITGLTWVANKILPVQVCPICSGVFVTWAGLLAAHFLGYEITLIIPALLMGGSVVGIAYQMEKMLAGSSQQSRLLLKILFIPAGFVAAYGILAELWAAAFLALAFLVLVSFLFLSSRVKPREGTVAEIEQKMKDCC